MTYDDYAFRETNKTKADEVFVEEMKKSENKTNKKKQ